MAIDIENRSLRPKAWRWLAGTLFIIIAWQAVGLILTIGTADFFDYDLESLFATDDATLAEVRKLPAWSTAATVLISFVPLFLATLLAYRLFLRRNIRALFTSQDKYSWRNTWIGFAVMSMILLILGGSDLLLNSDSYTWSLQLSVFLPYLLIAFTLLPIQTTAEELFFRGWLQQWLDNGRRSIWFICFAGGLLFAAPHMFNPEVSGNDLLLPLISYAATGFMLAWVSFRDKSLEIAIGAHFANNLLAALFISSTDSALPSVSLFTTPEVNWGFSAVISVLIVPIFIWLTRRWRDRVSS